MGIRKYNLNIDYFKYIDSEHKAYWLGYLYADGNVLNGDGRKYTVRLFADEKDVDALEKLRQSLESNKPIHWSKPSSTGRMGCVELCGKKLVEDVMKHGLIPNKTFKLTFPTSIPKELLRHFIRGYLDGDGCIQYEPPVVSLVGTESFCKSLRDFFSKELRIRFYLGCRHKERDNNIRYISIGGRHQVKTLLDWIYKDSTIYLDRKFHKYQLLLKDYEERYGVTGNRDH